MPASSSSVRLSAIGQIASRVRDLERAIVFYRDTLGVPFLFQAPPGLAFFRCGDLTLLLGPAERPEQDHPGSVLYFEVPDITTAHAELERRGVAFSDRPHLVHRAEGRELWLCFFRDPDENPLALMSWRSAAA
jgi:methylmalonyl-CoA/ethylmalonyl-CoA epimerase